MRRGPNRLGKPPTRRFNPGQRFRHPTEHSVYLCIGAYRLRDEPHEWIYVMSDMTPLVRQSVGMFAIDVVAKLSEGVVARIVVEPFRSSYDAMNYFGAFSPEPGARGDRYHVANKDLLTWELIMEKFAEVVDSTATEVKLLNR